MLNNQFGEFNNQLISDVANCKSSEITDLVMQQQPEVDFCNITDTMNNINNNKFNNRHEEDDFMISDDSPLPLEPTTPVSNDSNNNSNNDNLGTDNNFGPETDVDAIDEEFQANAFGFTLGEKEKTQMEFKETEDVVDRSEVMNFTADQAAAMFGTMENQILGFNEEISKLPSNPFSDDFSAPSHLFSAASEEIFNNDMIEQDFSSQASQEYEDNHFGDNQFEGSHFGDNHAVESLVVENLAADSKDIGLDEISAVEEAFEKEFSGANVQEEAIEKPEAGESIKLLKNSFHVDRKVQANQTFKFYDVSWLVFVFPIRHV